MKKVLPILGFSVLMILACASSPDKHVQAPDKHVQAKTTVSSTPVSAKVSQEDEEGKKLYNKYCRLCHGKDGKRGLNGSSDLSISKLSYDQMVEIVNEGRGTMTPFNFLGDEKIKLVVEYVETLKEEEESPE